MKILENLPNLSLSIIAQNEPIEASSQISFPNQIECVSCHDKNCSTDIRNIRNETKKSEMSLITHERKIPFNLCRKKE